MRITDSAVAQHCVNSDTASQFYPAESKALKRLPKMWHRGLGLQSTVHAKFGWPHALCRYAFSFKEWSREQFQNYGTP